MVKIRGIENGRGRPFGECRVLYFPPGHKEKCRTGSDWTAIDTVQFSVRMTGELAFHFPGLSPRKG